MVITETTHVEGRHSEGGLLLAEFVVEFDETEGLAIAYRADDWSEVARRPTVDEAVCAARKVAAMIVAAYAEF